MHVSVAYIQPSRLSILHQYGSIGILYVDIVAQPGGSLSSYSCVGIAMCTQIAAIYAAKIPAVS